MVRRVLFSILFIRGCHAQVPSDLRQLVRESVLRVQESEKKLVNYGYIRQRERKDFSPEGKLKAHRSWVEKREQQDGFMMLRLMERDFKPIPEDERRKNEAVIQRRVDELKAMTPEKRGVFLEEDRKREREERAWFRELPDAMDYKFIGEEIINGRPAWVLEAWPRDGYQPKSIRARVFQKARAKMWIDKLDSELVKADAEIFDTVYIGWGVLGRIDKGTKVSIQRRRVAKDTWFTEFQSVKFTARVLLIKALNSEIVERYSDFRDHGAEMRSG